MTKLPVVKGYAIKGDFLEVFVRRWPDIIAAVEKRAERLKIDPWPIRLLCDPEFPADHIGMIEETDDRVAVVVIPTPLYYRLQTAFIDSGIIPAPSHEQLATMIGMALRAKDAFDTTGTIGMINQVRRTLS